MEGFCGQCGLPVAAAELARPAAAEHERCLQRAELEPPRYCADCGRRMVVQVDPVGWRAVCSRHGELTG